MTQEDQAFFNNYFNKSKAKSKARYRPHNGNWTLHYGTLTWPKSTNAPMGVCQNKKKELIQEGKNPDKFIIKPA